MVQDEHPTARRGRGRTAWTLLGAAVVIAVLAGAGVVAWYVNDPTLGAQQEDRSQTYQRPVTAVEIRLDGGDVTLGTGAEGAVGVDRHLEWRDDKPIVTEEWDGTTLRVRTDCRGGDGCDVDYGLRLPPGTAVTVDSQGGSITSNGVRGALDLVTGGGDVTVNGARAAVTARTGGGAVTGSDLGSGNVTAETTGGDVRLAFSAAPAQVSGQSVGGAVDVAVPNLGTAGSGYQVRATGLDEDRSVQVPDDPRGTHLIIVSSEGGGVTVRYS